MYVFVLNCKVYNASFGTSELNSINFLMLETQHTFCYGQAVQKLKLNGEAQAYCGVIVSPYFSLIR